MSLPLIILGAGGHAKVLIDALGTAAIIGLTDRDPAKAGLRVLGVPVIGTDDALVQYAAGTVELVNGLGTVRAGSQRQALFTRYQSKGYRFATVVHRAAVIAREVVLGEGAQVMAGAILQPGCEIGENTLINTRAAVDHDCRIGRHVHIAPAAILSGGVEVEDLAHIGAGATVIQGIRIGAGSTVGAGAVVVRDVRAGVTVLGVPAKEIEQ